MSAGERPGKDIPSSGATYVKAQAQKEHTFLGTTHNMGWVSTDCMCVSWDKVKWMSGEG